MQGYGFTIDIVGSTYVSPKTGTISSTFKTIPDEPVGSFKLTLPQGRYPALAANTNLCKLTRVIHVKRKTIRDVNGKRRRITIKISKRIPAKLLMPTLFIAQNGARIKQNTPIAVTGCRRAKPKKKHKPGRRRKHHKK